MLYVRDRRKWLRFKRWLTAVAFIATLASVGGLEGEGAVPDYAWVLLGVFGWLLVNITNDYVRQMDSDR
jgi:hypothetical protein